MTFGISIYNLISYQYCIVVSSMEKRIKLSKTSSSSLPVQLESQPRWARCNSFSSCSNDSSVYSNNNHFNVRKHLANDDHQPARLIKRNRHSSGSSVSSNLSSISDKDTKKASIMIATSVADCPLNNSVIRKTELSSINCSDITSSSIEYNHNTIVNQALSCSTESSLSPFRHNLRRNIRKKTCSCDCTATCTTLVVRRFQEIGKKTVKSKTIISSTKVNTFMPNNGTPRIPNNRKPDPSRKRRSEVEKLYESLHEIEWAKNFSPDNILTQLNIRQAAACSVFGGSATRKTGDRSPRKSKNSSKQKFHSADESSRDSNCQNKSFEEEKHSSVFPSSEENSFTKHGAEKQSSFDINKYNANFHQYGKKIDSNDHKSEASVKFFSVPDRNFKKSDIQSSVESSQSESTKKVVVNHIEEVENTQLSCTSDDLSSIITVSNAELPSRHFLNYDFKCRSDVEIANKTEYSLIPAFINIAEEGIRTIDACFREVGAEVVVSTCDDSLELPLLSVIKESSLSSESSSNDSPPVLEPFVDAPGKISQRTKPWATKKKISSKNQNLSAEQRFTAVIGSKIVKLQKFRTIPVSKAARLLCKNRIRKQILKKYVKYLRTRRKFKKYLLACSNRSKKKNILFRDALKSNRTSCDGIIISRNKSESQNSDLITVSTSPLTFKSSELMYQTNSTNKKTVVKAINHNLSIYSYPDRLMFDYTKNDTTLVDTKDQKGSRRSTVQEISSSVAQTSVTQDQEIQQHSQTSRYISVTMEEKKPCIKAPIKEEKPHLQIPVFQAEFSCHYQCLRINKNHNYTQVILKYTRGKSIFLTLEALTELRDIVKRAQEDSGCHVLIINGMADCFCLGLDLKPLIGPRKVKASSELAVAVKEFIEALATFRKPLAAVVNGPAFGLGLTLLNHADVKIASENATFCMPYSLLGYTPEGGATLTLPKAVGSTVAMDLFVSGRTLTAQQAQHVGLISEVLEAKNLPQELVSRVRVLAQNSLSSLEATKALIQIPLNLDLNIVLENEVKLLPQMWLSKTCQERLQSAFRSGFLHE